jgi:glucokinase
VTDLVAMDVGGTHARFALGTVTAAGTIELGKPMLLNTSAYKGPEEAWRDYAVRAGFPLPPAAAIAIAGPVLGDSSQSPQHCRSGATAHSDATPRRGSRCTR